MVEQVGDGIWVVRAGAITSNSYILDAGDGQAALVDVGMDPIAIESALASLGKHPIAVLCTHGHFDHVGGAQHFVIRYGIRAYLHEADLRVAKGSNALLMLMGRRERIVLPEFDLVKEDFAFDVGGRPIRYRHTPGHTPGSCMLMWRDALFAGDTMYTRSMGLAQRPNEDLAGIRRSIKEMWPIIINSHIHPGHGPSEFGGIVAEKNEALKTFLLEGSV